MHMKIIKTDRVIKTPEDELCVALDTPLDRQYGYKVYRKDENAFIGQSVEFGSLLKVPVYDADTLFETLASNVIGSHIDFLVICPERKLWGAFDKELLVI